MQTRPFFSLEVFPPRKNANNNDDTEKIYNVLEDLSALKPDFISVTYGAGGSQNSDNTLKITKLLKHTYSTRSIAHLPCIHQSKEQVLHFLDECKKSDISDILALRGDEVENVAISKDFAYASDLVEFIKQNGDFNVFGACYPEKHTKAKDWVSDIKHLKIKVDSGVERLFTQMFLDNDDFYSFLEKCAIAEINVPIHAGIMPIVNHRQALKITSTFGAKLPPKFMRILNKYADKPEMMREAGIAYAVDQIVDLLTQGVSGIHLYVMNNSYVARRIHEATHCFFEC